MTTDKTTTGTRRRLASKINESTDVLWSNDSLGEVTDAVLEEFVVVPRSELPDDLQDGAVEMATSEALWANACHYIARAIHREARDAEQTEAKRNARRDELAVELSMDLKSYGERRDYRGLSTVAKNAIDRIIDLEDAAS